MQFKVGDRVRFLNTEGGGVITRMINSFMAAVAIEDGFEIPTLTSELVVIEANDNSGKMFLSEMDRKTIQTGAQAESQEPADVIPSPIPVGITGKKVPAGIYLLFSPRNQKQLLTSEIEVYLANHTRYDMLYSLYLKNDENKFLGKDYGSVPASSAQLIESVSREEIGAWSNGQVQVLLHCEESDSPLMPVTTSFRIKGSSFYSENSYEDTGLLGSARAIVYAVSELGRVLTTAQHRIGDKEKEPVIPESARRFAPEAVIDRHKTAPREAEVDLHISALRDNFSKLSPHEILTIQTGYFERTMESALARQYAKVIYIHGVGNGTLKQALISRIREYGDMEYRDASFAKYGTGALEVILHQNQ